MATKVWLGTTDTSWDTAGNWSSSGEPAASDSVYFNQDGTGTSGVAGSDQSGNTLARLDILKTYLYAFGSNGTPLKCAASIVNIGDLGGAGSANGSGRINLDLHTVATTVTVYDTGSSSTDTGKLPCRIKGTNASNVITVKGGSVGIATDSPSDTAQFPTMNVTGGALYSASGTTWTTANITAGTLTTNSAGTTVNQSGGTWVHNSGNLGTVNSEGGVATINGSGTITTLNAKGGTVYCNTSGTVSTIHIYDGTVDLTQSLTARTVSSVVWHEGSGQLIVDFSIVTVTAMTGSGRVRISSQTAS